MNQITGPIASNETPGLDKLRGFSIESARLLISKDDDGDNFVGTAILPNHSVFTFALVCSVIPLNQDLHRLTFPGECDAKSQKWRPGIGPGDDSERSASTR